MNRREFGRRAFQIAASLGLTSISLGSSQGCHSDPDGHDGDGGGTGDGDGDGSGVSVLIIGSGYGSAVSAMRLTEAGISVTMLEAGRLWDTPAADGTIFCKPFTPDGRAMWFADKTETQIESFFGVPVEMEIDVEAGILEARGPEEMRVFQGKGVGGGSLVNMAIYLAPEKDKLKTTLPMVDADEFFATYVPRAEVMLRAGTASSLLIASEFYQYSRVGIDWAEKAGFACEQLRSGYDFNYMEQELEGTVPRSALGGEAGFGNNYGKPSLDQTYLADAVGTGLLTIHALHVVKRIKTNPSGGYVVEAESIDIQGNVLERKEFTCTHLFVGAGSMATSELLVAARERGDLPDLNRAVGTKWGPNGDLFVALDNPSENPTGANQSTIPSHYFVAPDADGRRTVGEFAPLPLGISTVVSFVIVIADNPEAGHFTYDSESDTVELNWARSQNDPSVSSAKYIFDQINAKAGTVYTTTLTFKDEALFGDQVTYHPVGGVPLGDATDDFGRIREYPGLYVVDGSLIPIGIGANPSLAIAALAERNIEHIIRTDFA